MAERSERWGNLAERLRSGHEDHYAEEDAHTGQRNDEAMQTRLDHYPAVQKAERRAQHEPAEDGDGPGYTRALHEPAAGHGGTDAYRTNRKVKATSDDHHHHGKAD